MLISPWHENTLLYNLSTDYSLEKADPKKFFIYLIIYSPRTNNLQDWNLNITQYDNIDNYQKKCFWIKQNKKKIGGTVIYPNYFSCFFLIPPFNDSYSILKLIKKALITWSGPKTPIHATIIPPEYQEIFYRIGFQTIVIRRVMLRPTEKFDLAYNSWLKTTIISNPTVSESEEIAQFWLESYRNSMDESVFIATEQRKPTLKDNLTIANDFFTPDTIGIHYEPLLYASYLMREEKSKRIVAACLIAIWEE